MSDACPEEISDHTGFHFYKCGRPIKRNGYCGIHARMHEQREIQRNRPRPKSQVEIVIDQRDRARAIAAALEAQVALGAAALNVALHYANNPHEDDHEGALEGCAVVLAELNDSAALRPEDRDA